ncbi:leucyl aminopeptidase family protein [Phycicoccus sp. M110.8]|uniref:leucyl aminopeptidase family protein n=1 Tax=Phycicoccus sp. M110.8 TaxID=3075433 RepID=UPI0028FD16A4|nr:leucyl aminopeptidase family protein [Phycicoccus sp. M110.8]MDU0314847.1 leucyl aminopeptidase family protein [Phycicoccus sp. M110.8]
MPDPELLTPSTSDWSVQHRPLADVLADHDPADLALAVAVGGDGIGPAGAEALELVGLDATVVQATWEPPSTAGAVTAVPLPPGERAARTVLLVGMGTGSVADLRAAGAALGRAVRGRAALVTTVGAGEPAPLQSALAEGLALGGYTSPRWLSERTSASPAPVQAVALVGSYDGDVVRRSVRRATATMLARNLAVVPSNTKNPAWVAAQARTLGRRHGLDVTVWNERELRAQGFGGLLAVGAASATPPRLVRLDWTPEGAGARPPHVVLVGKGITFDTGGLDIKPAEGMLAMKTDMSGAGIVLSVLAACRDLAVPVRVTGLLALAENAVGAASYRPGDVITHYGGRTVEIGNTDAEGRLVMADALAYADLELQPDVLLDIATLTGAARVALGRSMAPVYATDDAVGEALVRAGEATGELLWPFPLVEDYRPTLDSDVADINHIAGLGGGGGSISAALFLREFAGSRSWAHLDIAGVGRSDVDSGLHTKGGTGFGARLLLHWLEEMR